MDPPKPPPGRSRIADVGLFLGPALAVVAWYALPGGYLGDGGAHVVLGPGARATAATGAWMATWWLTEAIPIPATALLPIALLPTLGRMKVGAVTAPYGHPLIFLFMGGFILSLAMQRWGLHRRFALTALARVGSRPDALVAGFMAVTALLSMWVSNTATALMMLPVGLSVVALAEEEAGADRLGPALLLGIAYAASIGGTGTLIGSPPNGFFASYAEQRFGHPVAFTDWMRFALPFMLVFLPLAWWLLVRVLEPVGRRRLPGVDALVAEAKADLGRAGPGERWTLLVFGLTALAWIVRPFLARLGAAGHHPLAGLSDAGIAMTAAALLFVLPVDWKRRVFVMDWETAARLPWGVLILFGGGLALAHAIDATGLGAFVGHALGGLKGVPVWVLVLAVTTVVVFLTELTSNTATAATFIPILASVATTLGLDPYLLMVPVALAASCAFMLPVATPPNAIVFGSGRISMRSMARAGMVLNGVSIVLVTAVTLLLVRGP